MEIQIKGQHIHYEMLGKGIPILLLHGWGGSMQSLLPLAYILKQKNFRVYLLDLPGFGKSELPKRAYSLDDYAGLVEQFVKRFHSGPIFLFGHSFGGSIAIEIALRKQIEIKKLILCNSSGIRTIRNERLKLIQSVSKVVKHIFSLPILENIYPPLRKLFYYYILRQRDYIDHQDKKETFQQILSEDITSELSKVDTPTLLLWGEDDRDTPVSYGKIMQLKIKNSKLKIIKSIGHGLPITAPELVASEMDRFIR